MPWSSPRVLLLLASSTSGASDWMHINLRTCIEVNFLGFIHLEQWADVPCMAPSAINFGIVQRGSHQAAQLKGISLEVMRRIWAAVLRPGCARHACSPCGTLTK